MEIIATLVVGALLGGGVVWFILRANAESAGVQARSEMQSEVAGLNERVLGKQEQIEQLERRLRERDSQIAELQSSASGLQANQSRLETMLQKEREAAAEKLAYIEDARTKLADAFKALSAEALNTNNKAFLELARTNLEKFQEGAKGDLEKRQEAITNLVKPVKESLEKFDTKIQELEKVRVGAYEGLTAQVQGLLTSQTQLRTETSNLVRALAAPKTRGRWGEVQLKRVVELAGMINKCDFAEQVSVATEDGRLRPDLMVYLPAGKNIVVDAKTPLAAYLEAIEATDDVLRRGKFQDHARQVRDHIKELSGKAYWSQFEPAPEFVVLFLPGETFFSVALEHDPELIEYGAEQRVIIATPTTLIALLKAVAYGWRQEALAVNAKEISDLGRELYKRVMDMGAHFNDLGTKLGRAVESYNKAVGTLESRVMVSARRFKDLESTGTESKIPPLEIIETAPRQIEAITSTVYKT